VTVDLDDRVVDIDHDRPEGIVEPGDQRRPRGQPGQEAGGDRIQLADMAEGERTQERAQRRGRIGVGENTAHATVPQQRHVLDAVRAGRHPRDQRSDLQPGVGSLVGGHTQMLIG
jgi:hypothetical protein